MTSLKNWAHMTWDQMPQETGDHDPGGCFQPNPPELRFRWQEEKQQPSRETYFNTRLWETQSQPFRGKASAFLCLSVHLLCSWQTKARMGAIDLWLFFLFSPGDRTALCGPQEKQNIKAVDRGYETGFFFC